MKHNFEAFLKKYEKLTKEEALYEMFKYNCDFQQRIDKAIKTIDEMISGTYIDKSKDIPILYYGDEASTIRLKIIKNILQGEKVED